MPEIKNSSGSSDLVKNSNASQHVKATADSATKLIKLNTGALDAGSIKCSTSFEPQRREVVPPASISRENTLQHKDLSAYNNNPASEPLKYKHNSRLIHRDSSGRLRPVDYTSSYFTNSLVHSNTESRSRLVKIANQGNVVRSTKYIVKNPNTSHLRHKNYHNKNLREDTRSARYAVIRMNGNWVNRDEPHLNNYVGNKLPPNIYSSTDAVRNMVHTTNEKQRESRSYRLKDGIKLCALELTSGSGAKGSDDQATSVLKNVRRSSVRAVGAVYGANRLRKKRAEEAQQKLIEARGKYATPRGQKLVEQAGQAAGRKAMSTSLKKSLAKEVGDKVVHIQSNGENYAVDGLVDAKNVTVGAYRSVKVAKITASKAVQTANIAARRISKAAKAVYNAVQALGQFALKLGAASPVLLGVIAIFVVILVVMTIVPTFTLKSTDVSLTKLYKYCTELDTTFSVEVTKELSKADHYYRLDFHQNGAKSNGQSSWKVETDLDMLLAYYDAMFEDYSTRSNDDLPVDDDEEVGEQENPEEANEFSHDYLKSNFKTVKKYSKNLWKELYTLETGTHTEQITYTDSSGRTHTRMITVLDVYVTTNSIMQLAQLNAKNESGSDVKYSLLETPFGYLTSSQQEMYDILQEVGLYTALEEVPNPFSAPTDEEATSWSVSRRYGYFLDNKIKAYNDGIFISAQKDAAVYAGVNGKVHIEKNHVIIKSDSREIIYGPLEAIQITDGDMVTVGMKIGSVTDENINGSPALFVGYKRGGKELNPLFFIAGYSGKTGTGGGGNGDIVATALAEVGTLETPVNNVKYNDWFYGAHREGIDVPWCAAFVTWCADQNGYIDAGIVPKSAFCPDIISFYAAQGRFYRADSSYVPVPGDFIMFSSSSYPHGGAHIGIVVSCDGSTVYTVEGNTSNSSGMNPNGGGVWTKSYRFAAGTASSGIWGYCNPAYPSFSNAAPPEGAVLLGTYQITHYCPCAICNGSYVGQPTASGTQLTVGRTIAVDKSLIPLGSQVFIEGYGNRTAEDTGSAIIGKHIDMFVATHAEAMDLGVVYKKVYIVK